MRKDKQEAAIGLQEIGVSLDELVRRGARWMRMVTIPNQSSVAKAYQEFDANGRIRPSPYYERLVDVMEELVKFTLIVRDRSDYLTSLYSERKEAAPDLATTLAAAAMSHEANQDETKDELE